MGSVRLLLGEGDWPRGHLPQAPCSCILKKIFWHDLIDLIITFCPWGASGDFSVFCLILCIAAVFTLSKSNQSSIQLKVPCSIWFLDLPLLQCLLYILSFDFSGQTGSVPGVCSEGWWDTWGLSSQSSLHGCKPTC